MKSILGLKAGIDSNLDDRTFSRKMFLSYPTEVFINNEEIEFIILNEIKTKWRIPFTNIKICGSAKLGISIINNRKFIPGTSDLDVAIIDNELYQQFIEISHYETKSYTDLYKFPKHNGDSTYKRFMNSISKGYINPYFMPQCRKRGEWLDFFLRLSNKYFYLFKNINAGIYSSEYFFESKQETLIQDFKTNPNKYDKISS